MKKIKFELMDLNLLRVFDAVNEERSLVDAGRRLNVTPSAISHALGRLRLQLDDELFVRSPEGMQPTHLAEQIGPKIHQVLLNLRLILAPTSFDPSHSDHRFNINCGPYLSAVFLPRLAMRMRAEAPHVRLNARWFGVDIVDELDSGRIDLALGAFGAIPERFDSESLFSDKLIWASSAEFASEGQTLSLEQLAERPHVVGVPLDDGIIASDRSSNVHGLERHVPMSDHGHLEKHLAQHGLQRNVVLTVPGSVAALTTVANSDMIALVPRRQAQSVAQGQGLRLFEAPYYLPPIHIKSLWHKNFGSQPPLAWFRQLVKRVAMEIEEADVAEPQ